MELLEPWEEGKLNKIQSGSHKDVSEQCKLMFQLWLENCSDATWGCLIQALKEVGLNQLALKTKRMLQSAEGTIP